MDKETTAMTPISKKALADYKIGDKPDETTFNKKTLSHLKNAVKGEAVQIFLIRHGISKKEPIIFKLTPPP